MALGVDDMTAGAVIRKRIYLAVGMFLTAFGIALAYFAMRSVMDVGGFCASGGPYEIRQQCPDDSWMLFVAFPAGLIGCGFMAAGTIRNGPAFLLLAWSALFLALGANFLEYGIDPPAPATGLAWGWLICAVVFLLMGGLPLIYMLRYAREFFWEGGEGNRRGSSQLLSGLTTRSATGTTIDMSSFATGMPTIVIDNGTFEGGTAFGEHDITESLERLAALYASGALSDEEFAAAKAQLLQGG